MGARDLLWSLIFHRQVADGKLVDGFGFGVNLPYLVNDTQVTSGADPLRSPHNSHDDVLSRMGLIGISLWIALWLGWYWRLVTGCRRLARRGLHARRQVGVLCMMVGYGDPGVLVLRSPAGGSANSGAAVDRVRGRSGSDQLPRVVRPANTGLGHSGVPVTASR